MKMAHNILFILCVFFKVILKDFLWNTEHEYYVMSAVQWNEM